LKEFFSNQILSMLSTVLLYTFNLSFIFQVTVLGQWSVDIEVTVRS